MHKLGEDTFRGLASSSSELRHTFFGKTLGEVGLQHDLLSVQSPISGSTLTAPDLARRTTVKDPISGATLQLIQQHAEVVAPVLRQQQVSPLKMGTVQRNKIATLAVLYAQLPNPPCWPACATQG